VGELAAKGEKPILVPEDMPLPMILRLVSDARCAYFPVVNKAGELAGIFSVNDIRRILNEDLPPGLIIARDLATQQVISATPDEHLTEVMKKITSRNLDEIPVVESDNPRRVKYMLSRRAVLAHYAEEVEKTRILYQQN
jgi:CIC family chloride channel protein